MPNVRTPRGSVNYEVTGSGDPLMLIPGLGLDHNYYRLGIPLLAKHFEVIAVDPLGIGASEKPEIEYRVESWADDFAFMIDALGRGPVHILGSSLGGAMALALAHRHPAQVRTLIAVGAFSEFDRAGIINFDLRSRLIKKLGLNEDVADYMGLWTMTREFVNSDEGFAQMRRNQAIIRSNSSELYLKFVQSVLAWVRALPGSEGEPLFTTLLGEIKCPTLVLSADNDQLVPLEASRILARHIPGAQLRIMPGAGHIPFIERPVDVSGIVTEFLTTHRKAAA